MAWMRRLSRTRVSLLLLLMAAPAVCAAPDAILHTGPGTTIDGIAAIDGMRVFGGKTVSTPRGHVSDLILRGTALRMLGDTQLRFNGDSAELIAGAVLLTTNSQFKITSRCATVTPRSDDSRYLVQTQGKLVYVGAQKNDVAVKSRKTAVVNSGKTVAVYCAAPAEDIVTLGNDAGAKIAMAVSSAGAAAAGTSPLWDMSASSPAKPEP
jgi:hypothetical protein